LFCRSWWYNFHRKPQPKEGMRAKLLNSKGEFISGEEAA
jgi:hypothetical protein